MTAVAEHPPVIELANVDAVSPVDETRCLLAGIQWQVAAGDFWVIKSSLDEGADALLLTAAGVQRPAKGFLRLFGCETWPARPAEWLPTRLRLGVVLRGGGRLFPDMTVAENVIFAYCYHRNCRLEETGDWPQQLLAWMELDCWAGRWAGELPRALAPRVGLARALTLRPEVLLLEHPLFGLEPLQERWWLGRLSELSAGHPLWEGRPLTLVASDSKFQPWLGRAKQFAVIQERCLRVLADEADARRMDAAFLIPSVMPGESP